jgi:hypothetical protein
LPHFRQPRPADRAAPPPDAGGRPEERVAAADPTAAAHPTAVAGPTAAAAPAAALAEERAAAAPRAAPAAMPAGSSPLSLLGPGPQLPAPGHEGLPAPVLDAAHPTRSGDIGAAVLNDLVDRIERDIEKDLGRLVPETALPAYRGAVPCTFDPAASARGARPAPPRPPRR